MRNQQLEHELERIDSYDEIRVKAYESESSEESYYLDSNDNSYTYYVLSQLISDCIELSKRFELVFV